MAVRLIIDIKQNSQNIANNTSNVTVNVNAAWDTKSYNHNQKSGSVTIDGTKYTFTSPFNLNTTSSGSCTLYTKTLNITHDSDGTKTLAVSAQYNTGVSSGTIAASVPNYALTTIPRKSTLSVANGTLGTAQTLTVTRQSTSFTHTITYTCGSASGTICTKSSSTSISFTPPLTLASQNTTGTSVSIKYTITTYNGSTSVGSNSYTKTCAIPASVKPSCSISVSDPTGYANTYGAYIQGLSKFAVVVTPTLAHSSPIASYKTQANGVNYTTASFTTDVIKSVGANEITANVTDKRGRKSDTKTFTANVLAYTPPAIDYLKPERYNIDFQPDPQGDRIMVNFGATVSPLNNLNTATYIVQYKKLSDADYTTGVINAAAGNFSPSGNQFLFNAEPESSYEVILIVEDAFNTARQTYIVPSASAFISFRKDYKGLALNKIAEEDDVFDVNWETKFRQPVSGKVAGLDRLPAIPTNGDMNDYMQTGCWAVQSNAIAETVANIPVPRAGRLEVISSTGEGIRETQWSYLRQKYTPYNSSNAVYERDITRSGDNIWRFYEWNRTTLTPEAAQKVYSRAAMTIALSANSVLGNVNTYTKIPFNKSVLSTSDRLTLSSDAIRIGAGIQHIKVNGQVLVSPGSTDGLRHIRIQKVSETTTTSVAWSTLYFTGSRHLAHVLTPLIVSVKEGDLLQMVFYTGNASDSISSGTAANGYQTYLTVEEL